VCAKLQNISDIMAISFAKGDFSVTDSTLQPGCTIFAVPLSAENKKKKL